MQLNSIIDLNLCLYLVYIICLINKSIEDETSEVPALSPPVDLCTDPVIYSIDRMINGSVWIYRDNHYWQLDGLPDKSGILKGPFPIWWENMAPVQQYTLVMTSVTGEDAKNTFRIKNNRFWAYNPSGQLYIGGKDGNEIEVPTNGLTAVLFNGNESNALMIGFQNVHVFYYKFKSMKWQIDGEKDGYVQGRYGENFPTDLDSAFAWPPDDPNDGYIAYLFKKDKYCKRFEKLKSGKTCDEWRDNKELFGCNTGDDGGDNPSKPSSTVSGGEAEAAAEDTITPLSTTGGSPDVRFSGQLLTLVLIVFCFVKFYI